MVGDWERRGAEGKLTGLIFSHFFEKKQQFLNYHFKIIFERVPSEIRGVRRALRRGRGGRKEARGGCEEARGEARSLKKPHN